MEKLLRAGTLAPSIDNCQPWRFVASDTSIAVYLDRERAEFFGDYAYTASYVTLGMVVENIVLAASGCGLEADAAPFPEGRDTPVARIRLREATIEPDPLATFLETRCTNRKRYRTIPLPEDVSRRLAATPAPAGAHLHLIEDRNDMRRLASLGAEVDRVIFDHHLLHANLFRWLRWNENEIRATRDGMPVGTLEISAPERLFFRLLSSWHFQKMCNFFGTNRIVGAINSRLLTKASALGLVVMDGAGDVDFFNGGRFFERVWLQATSLGLSFQPFGGVPFLVTRIMRAGADGFSERQFARLRRVSGELQEIVPFSRNNALVILFRVGYAGQPTARAIRRPIEEVLVK